MQINKTQIIELPPVFHGTQGEGKLNVFSNMTTTHNSVSISELFKKPWPDVQMRMRYEWDPRTDRFLLM